MFDLVLVVHLKRVVLEGMMFMIVSRCVSNIPQLHLKTVTMIYVLAIAILAAPATTTSSTAVTKSAIRPAR